MNGTKSAPSQDGSMQRGEVIAVIREFLLETKPEETKAVEDDTDLFEIGALDSLAIVSMVVFIEERFGFSLDYEDLTEENLGSLSAIADTVLRKVA